MSDEIMDVEDVSFLPVQPEGIRFRGDRKLDGNKITIGENLNRKSLYEPSLFNRCKRLVCSKGRATAIIVIMGILILIIVLVATLTHRGSLDQSCANQMTTVSPIEQTTINYVATNGEAFPWQNIRLPRDVMPMTYDIFLHPNISQRIFTGNVKIKLKVVTATNRIILHIKDMNITDNADQIHIKSLKSNNLFKVIKMLEFEKYNQLYIEVDKLMDAHEEVEMKLNFRANLIKKLSGFYLSSYKSENGETRYLGTTQMEPTGAREAFPCLDEPDMKAQFSMSIVRDKNYISLFNMPLLSTTPYNKDSNLVVDKFDVSVKMSTYLVAFIVAPHYAYVSGTTKGNVTVRVFAPDEQINRTQFALQCALTVLDLYDDLYAIKYPLPKQDLIAIPDFSAGAMENWGLITYRMTSILFDPVGSSASDQQWVATVIAHELAHQWFGNLVTLKWWDDLWLNEGFASFMEYLGAEKIAKHIKKTWHMNDQFIKDDLQRAMFFDSLQSSHPIQVRVDNPDQINDLFDDISYNKGSSIIRMLRDIMGVDRFNTGITAYLKKYKFGNAVTSELWESLSKTGGSSINVSKVMDTWTMQMGYPVVSVKRSGDKLTLTQERYLLYPNSEDSGDFTSQFNYKWYIPFSYITDSDNTKKIVWLNMNSATVDVPSSLKWIKGNYGMFGYYRVNYEESMWQAIIKQLNDDHTKFSTGDRSGLIDDVFQLARAGHVKITTALDITKYLSKDEDYLPWEAALSNLGYIKNRIRNFDVYDIYKKYILHLLQNLIDKLGWEDKGDQLQVKLRSLVIEEAIELGHEKTIEKAKELFKIWKDDSKSKKVSANFKNAVFTAGVKYGEEEDWKLVLDRYKVEMVPTEKRRLLKTLGHTRDATLLSRLLKYSLNETMVKHQDFAAVIASVALNPAGELLAWRFTQRHWDLILSWFRTVSFTMGEIIKYTTSRFSTQFDYEEVKKFFENHDAGPGERAMKAAEEKIQGNIEWIKRNQDDVISWFENIGKTL